MMILLGDDSAGIRLACKEQLEARGHRVLLARHGGEVLELVDHVRVDLVVLDVEMPQVDGLAALERLRAAGHHMPVVLHTSHEPASLASEARRLGAVQCVQKSGDGSELAAAIDSVRGATPPRFVPSLVPQG